jgi:glc operon protein GlcG
MPAVLPARPRRAACALAAAGALACVAPRPAAAQVVRQAPTLSLEGARRALVAADSEATRLRRTVCVVVVDPGGEPIALTRADGVLPAFCDVARAKARTAVRYGRPSDSWAQLLGRGNAGALANLPDMFAVEGAVPVLVDGVVVGAVGVSGAPSEDDARVARAGAQAVSGAPAASD